MQSWNVQTYSIDGLDDLDHYALTGDKGSTRFGGADGELGLCGGEEGCEDDEVLHFFGWPLTVRPI